MIISIPCTEAIDKIIDLYVPYLCTVVSDKLVDLYLDIP